ncbi:MAG: isoprenylcysteine carboxylmethyltransferase family protein [Polyangiaceae bacterium]
MNIRDLASPAEPSAASSVLIYVPPPLLFVGSFVAGARLHRLVPGDALPATAAPVTWVIGAAAILCASLLLVSAPGLFLVHRTTIIPHATSRALVTSGPFRLTRNPMYLALAVAYVGVALTLNITWPLLMLGVPLWIVHTKIIPREEWALTQAFGDEYGEYKKRVRRWL